MYLIQIDNDKCTGCEECVNNCPQVCFQMKDGKSDPFQSSECVMCETCLNVCPTNAITITEM